MLPWWGQLLVGLGVMLACVGALLRGIWEMDTRAHQWEKCSCRACAFRRRDVARRTEVYDKYNRLNVKATPLDHVAAPRMDKIKSWFKTTAELEPRRSYCLSGEPYFIREISTDSLGYMISVSNIRTRQLFIMSVSFQSANHRIWEPL